MKNDRVFIGKSSIHRYGVFAARNLKKGEVVTDWNVMGRLTKNQVEKLTASEKKCVSAIGDGGFVLIGVPARYVNHSCDANTYMVKLRDVASRNIKKGEEITANYSDEECAARFKCSCGGKNCRKLIP